jgi:hypothetical protein
MSSRLCSNVVKECQDSDVVMVCVEEVGVGGLACEDVGMLVRSHCEHARSKSERLGGGW